MYEEHSRIATPPDDTVIWRYMNLDKLLAMLCDRSLFMCRLDKFRDPWEGVWPKPVVDEVRSHMDESQTEWFLTFLEEKMKNVYYVNCWHAGEHESAALWDSYAGHAGLAVKSSVGRLSPRSTWNGRFTLAKCLTMTTRNTPFLVHSVYSSHRFASEEALNMNARLESSTGIIVFLRGRNKHHRA